MLLNAHVNGVSGSAQICAYIVFEKAIEIALEGGNVAIYVSVVHPVLEVLKMHWERKNNNLERTTCEEVFARITIDCVTDLSELMDYIQLVM